MNNDTIVGICNRQFYRHDVFIARSILNIVLPVHIKYSIGFAAFMDIGNSKTVKRKDCF